METSLKPCCPAVSVGLAEDGQRRGEMATVWLDQDRTRLLWRSRWCNYLPFRGQSPSGCPYEVPFRAQTYQLFAPGPEVQWFAGPSLAATKRKWFAVTRCWSAGDSNWRSCLRFQTPRIAKPDCGEPYIARFIRAAMEGKLRTTNGRRQRSAPWT
jgi:hypothetical protein